MSGGGFYVAMVQDTEDAVEDAQDEELLNEEDGPSPEGWIREVIDEDDLFYFDGEDDTALAKTKDCHFRFAGHS
jgi:hypothetical protein